MNTRAFLIGLCLCGASHFAVGADNAQTVFERRILPIFKSPNPSSCTECHLAGVDLKSYILPSHEKTFLSLRDQGLIDLENPADSKILRLIAMGGGTNQGAALISAKVREPELAAFADWIQASARDPKLRSAAKLAPAEVAKPSRPLEVIRYARPDRLLASFEENIWSQRFRCSGCHSPKGSENAKLVEKHGEQVSWMTGCAEDGDSGDDGDCLDDADVCFHGCDFNLLSVFCLLRRTSCPPILCTACYAKEPDIPQSRSRESRKS